MAGSVNKVILVGNLGADPEIRSMQSGDRVANLSIATSERWKDRNGERQEKTEWHRVSIFTQPLVNLAENYLKKGSKVYIEGQLQTRKWQDQNGQDKYTTEVVLRPFKGEITMLDSRGDSSGFGGANDGGYQSGPDQSQPQSQAQPIEATGGGAPAGETGPVVDEMEDEIPF